MKDIKNLVENPKLVMNLIKPRASEYLTPGTLWVHRVQGHWEIVYLESLSSKLVLRGEREVDFLTPFGLEHMPTSKFLEKFKPIGYANITMGELCSLRNLKWDLPEVVTPMALRAKTLTGNKADDNIETTGRS